MAKYHINPNTGNPGVCRADPSKPNARGCDFDLGESDHYASADEARTAYEASMADEATPAAAKPVDKRTLRLQAKAAFPTEHSFGTMVAFDYNEAREAQQELLKGLSKEEKIAQGWKDESGVGSGPKWQEYFLGSYGATRRESELNLARYAAALENDATDPRPISEVVASGAVDESSPRVRLNDAEHSAAEAISMLPRTTQEMVYRQPAAFLKVLADTPGGNSNARALAQLSDEIRAQNPGFAPRRGEVPPARVSGRRSEEGVPQMQKMGPYGYGLLQDYARTKFGDRAKEFWLTVESNSVNYPKISDFMRAAKEFS